MFEASLEKLINSNEHQAYGKTREKLTFAMRKCCLLLLCATVVIAATLAHVGLFSDGGNLLHHLFLFCHVGKTLSAAPKVSVCHIEC